MTTPPSPIRILDGGLGTSLEDGYGVRFSSDTTPLWSSHLLVLPDPDGGPLLGCQGDFCRAGVDILETATYQVSAKGFANTRVPPEWPDGIRDPTAVSSYLGKAIDIAERAAASRRDGRTAPSLALSLGPYGACMIPSTEYSGDYDTPGQGIDALRRWHADRLRLFIAVPQLAQRVQYIAFETVPRLDEIVAIRQLFCPSANLPDAWPLADVQPLPPYWISCVFPGEDSNDADGGSQLNLPDGTSVERAVEAILSRDTTDAGGVLPWGIGINCTKIAKLPRLIDRYESVVAGMVESNRLAGWPALLLYPDGTNGEVYNTATQKWIRPERQSAPKVSWEAQLGAIVKTTAARAKWRKIVVGGCCKTTCRDIAALRAALLEDKF